MMWKIQQAMQDNGIQTVRVHPAFILVTGLKLPWVPEAFHAWFPGFAALVNDLCPTKFFVAREKKPALVLRVG